MGIEVLEKEVIRNSCNITLHCSASICFWRKQFGTLAESDQPVSRNIGTPVQDSVVVQRLEHFSHVDVIWWFDGCDGEASRNVLEVSSPYANDGSPVLDLKPYTPSIDRVEHPIVLDWCSHWPKSYEESADFAWENEFNF